MPRVKLESSPNFLIFSCSLVLEFTYTLTSSEMSGVLTASSAASPFPFAAVAIATYTGKAELAFEESTSGISLELNGSKLTAEDEIVRALAKAGGLADDSAKVRNRSCE